MALGGGVLGERGEGRLARAGNGVDGSPGGIGSRSPGRGARPCFATRSPMENAMNIVRSLLLVVAFVPLLVAPPGWCQEAPPEEEPAPQAPAPMEFDTYQLVLLVRPAERAELPPERVQEIQAAHIGHLGRMAREGHLVAAGPFGDQEDERLRGLALYRVGSVEEARRLAEADPAVQAGRLEVEVMTWYTEKGALAFPAFEELRAGQGSGD